MVLTLHHLGLSQSERIIWLAEELGIEYKYVHHSRDPIFSPQSIKDLHPAGTAPVMEDDPSPVTGSRVVIAESGAIADYLIAVYGNGRLGRTPRDGAEYSSYLEWFHFANGSLQPTLFRLMMAGGPASDPNSPIVARTRAKWDHLLDMMNARLGDTGAYLAGKELSAADIMTVCTLTTMRGFCPIEFDTVKNGNILAYLKRIGERPAYQKAMLKCEGEHFKPILGPKAEVFDILKPKI
jgi:glutathione S-transferase